MKKFIYVIGFIGAAMLVGGVTLKVLNMSGGYELYMIGLVLILLGFMPFLVINKNRETGTSLDRWKSIAGVVSSVVVGLSVLFKLLHLQGTEFLLLAGATVFAVGFLPLFFISMYRKSAAP